VTQTVSPPVRLKLRRGRNLAIGTVIAVGALSVGCKSGPKIDSDSAVPSASAATPSTSSDAEEKGFSVDASDAPIDNAVAIMGNVSDAGTTDAGGVKVIKKTPPIMIRQHPPKPMLSPEQLRRNNEL
jgi:hypothetical protein